MSSGCAELPDAPAEVQVEAGPQHGTLLVMWLPVKVTERSCTSAITGYSVYVDGRRVKELQSPTGTLARYRLSLKKYDMPSKACGRLRRSYME